MEQTVHSRQTKYCTAITHSLRKVGHASNAELLAAVRREYPEVTATTIHRATARLASRGEIGVGPRMKEGSMSYDANVTPHDHFQCVSCGMIKDAQLSEELIPLIEHRIGDGCSISGSIVVNGTCKACVTLASS